MSVRCNNVIFLWSVEETCGYLSLVRTLNNLCFLCLFREVDAHAEFIKIFVSLCSTALENN